MPDRSDAVVGASFTLDATFKLRGSLSDVTVVKVELEDRYGSMVQRATSVSRVSVGHYRATFSGITESGTYTDNWFYVPVSGAQQLRHSGTVQIAGFSTEEGDPVSDATSTSPVIPDEEMCTLTITCATAGGAPLRGVIARFTPEATQAMRETCVVMQQVDSESDSSGVLRLSAPRGATGMLGISHLGIARRVTFPDAETTTLVELLAESDDFLTPIAPLTILSPV